MLTEISNKFTVHLHKMSISIVPDAHRLVARLLNMFLRELI